MTAPEVLRSLELCAGAGGQALGVSYAGFHHMAVIEKDSHACSTIRENQERGVEPVVHWPLHEMGVEQFDYSTVPTGLDLLSGGPPCQPFSKGGKCRGPEDERDMFPQVVRAVREVRPRTFILENVRGLLRPAFTTYLDYIRLQLMYPEVTVRSDEKWLDHLSRIESHYISGGKESYRLVIRPVNAADYGVPQHRERVIIVGFKSDLGTAWSFPETTHSEDALIRDKWVTKEYWEQHKVSKRKRPQPPAELQNRIDSVKERANGITLERWMTVRDAISVLPDPEDTRRARAIPNHVFVPGARSYTGHTGSVLDEPAKALKAGDHGVPGGENMLRKLDGKVRYFTTRECARLQGFPDEFVFQGSWGAVTRQLGNAVPVQLSQLIAHSVRNLLVTAES